jgi:hypothetical protein
MTLQWIPEPFTLGVTSVADCQAACLKLPAEQQALCLNSCIPPEPPPKTGLAAGVAAVMVVGSLVIGFLAGSTFQTKYFEDHGVPDWLMEKERRRLRENPAEIWSAPKTKRLRRQKLFDLATTSRYSPPSPRRAKNTLEAWRVEGDVSQIEYVELQQMLTMINRRIEYGASPSATAFELQELRKV